MYSHSLYIPQSMAFHRRRDRSYAGIYADSSLRKLGRWLEGSGQSMRWEKVSELILVVAMAGTETVHHHWY